MNKPLSAEQLESLSVTGFPTMTKREKLLRWAKIVREHKSHLVIFHLLEHMTHLELKSAVHSGSAFALAASDPVLSDAGMPKTASAYDAMKFFDLSREDLHTFSCNCGGYITNEDMAFRIESLALGA